MSRSRPPYMSDGDIVVLYDGVCKLCEFTSRFIIRHDRARRLRLCPMQSEKGQALLIWFGLPTERFDSVIVLRGGRAYERSDAAIEVARQLPLPWRLATAASLVPRGLRDRLYEWIARNRYRIFGQNDQCLLPTPDTLAHFL